jgi:hypothetical protein
MSKITGNDILKIALANPDVIVPPDALDAIKPQKGKNKFNAVAVVFDNIRFDSKAELKRYGDLRWLELEKQISDLKVHPTLELYAGVKYKPDFMYIENGVMVVEDVKGGKATQLDSFKNKWKQAQAKYPEFKFVIIGG